MTNKVISTVRDDGLRIVSKRLPYTNRVMTTIATLVGSASDPEDTSGLFHFFEHMAFQGTKTRTAEEIASLLDLFSRENNACTSYICTKYYGIGIKNNWKKLFEIIADMYSNSIFPKKELRRERKVIENEIAMYNGDDNNSVFRNLINNLYTINPVVRHETGTEEGIKNVSRNLLLKTHQKFYVPSNTIVVVTGDVKHSDVLKTSEMYIEHNYAKPPERTVWSDESETFPRYKEVIEKRPDREMALIYLGTKLPHADKKERLISNLLCDLIGNGASSPLYTELRQKRGLVYSTGSMIYSENSVYQLMIFFAETLNKNIKATKELLMKTAMTCDINPISFSQMKERMIEDAIMELETAEDWNEEITFRLMTSEGLDSLEDYQNKLAKILREITLDDVLSMRKRILTEERMAFSILKSK